MKKISLLVAVVFSGFAFAQTEEVKEEKKGNFFGGFESNSQWYTNDKDRGIAHPEDPFRSNS